LCGGSETTEERLKDFVRPISVRRSPAVVAVLLATALATSCTEGLDEHPTEPASQPPSQPSPTSPQPTGPEQTTAPDLRGGMRWLGLHDVVVAVPEGWGTQTQPCAPPHGNTVHFLGASSHLLDCAADPTTGVSSLTIAAISDDVIPLRRGVDRTTNRNGLRLLHGGSSCLNPARGPCELTFAVPEDDVAFRVDYRGDQPDRFVRTVKDSVTRLPSGLRTVPFIDYGSSIADVEELIRTAGLEVRFQDSEGPADAIHSEPAAGTVVKVGRVVTVMVGDG
jgi:hypothetical protein